MMKPIRNLTVSLSAVAFAHASVAAEEGPIPQMDPTWFPNQILWLAICFILLYAIVSRFIIPSVGGVLATRQTIIDEAIAKAEDFKKNAGAARGDVDARAQDAHAKAAALLANALKQASLATAERMAALNAELETRESLAAVTLQQNLKSAEAEMRAATADVARALAEKVLGSPVDAAAVATALKKAA